MGVSQSIFKVIRFPRLQSLPLFFSLVPIHSVSTYIDALCSILSNFTRPGPYSISPLVLAGKQMGYDYPTFLTCCYIGCHIGGHFVGALAYADDVTLVAPSRSGIRTLIIVCEQFALDYDITFNGTKSQLIIF